MAKECNVIDIIKQLQKGKVIKCLECGEGTYQTSGVIEKSLDFRCDKCGSVIRVSPNITVE